MFNRAILAAFNKSWRKASLLVMVDAREMAFKFKILHMTAQTNLRQKASSDESEKQEK